MSVSAKARAVEHPQSHDDSTKALISSQQKGRVWITDGSKNQRLFLADAAPLLDSGLWRPGKTLKPGTVYKNKGHPQTAAQIAANKAGADKRRGRPRSQEAIKKTAEGNRGRKNSPDGLANLRAAGEKRRGRKRDPEVVARIQETKRLKKGAR